MVNIPVKFRRIAAAFDDAARAARSCDSSSGSDHSAADLSVLVNSFLERGIGELRTASDEFDEDISDDRNRTNGDDDDESDRRSNVSDFDFRNSLEKLFDEENLDRTTRSLRSAVETALPEVAAAGDFKRRLMSWLRNRGFDAGLCKSKWEKNGNRPSGDYEYVDINAGGNRFIVEVFLAGEFTIARPTSGYASLLDAFPTIFVGKPDELKKIVKLMCKAIKKSMKSTDLKLPPWRRLSYTQIKWFGPYKRTTNQIPTTTATFMNDNRGNTLVGFEPPPAPLFSNPMHCREDFTVAAGRIGVGNLAIVLNNKDRV
ncbi:uncharacterized protein LOC127247879 [Andrographis paniculata]|uniref:uncharacterized protein LOC127247879 n=1 Tax=Andrographis paniculata TaxID=175694 RepID=UPI0021E7CF9D|nr:uncharacterized protein LOC127247879 [Andrographis paniculata]